MMTRNDIRALVYPLGIPLLGLGGMMMLCLIPSLHFYDGTALPMFVCGLFTLAVGLAILGAVGKPKGRVDRRVPFLLVALIWLVLSFFGTLPFLATGSVTKFSDALFESMSGITSTGATIFSDVEHLPPSILLWRSMSQWIGGFGIILMVLAFIPSLGINKYSLYTAEASGADNSGKGTITVSETIRRTLSIYILLTLVFVLLLRLTGMHIWDAVNLVFTNISSGGFCIYNDSLASITHRQQGILALAMFFSGINFSLLFYVLTFRFGKIRHKLDQFGFYLVVIVVGIAGVMLALHYAMDYSWKDSFRCSAVQTLSVLTTTGSLVEDTSYWWTPVLFFYVVLSLCGGMAGSTSGGLKVMRVLILFRNVRNILRNRLHPSAVNPVRLNGKPVSHPIINNVMVIFFVYLFTIILGVLLLMICGINATESFGACIACITGYGPGLGASGGLGCYEAFTVSAKWIASLLMLMGRLECLTVIILLIPRFWKQ